MDAGKPPPDEPQQNNEDEGRQNRVAGVEQQCPHGDLIGHGNHSRADLCGEVARQLDAAGADRLCIGVEHCHQHDVAKRDYCTSRDR